MVGHFPPTYARIQFARALLLESAICLMRRRLWRLEPLIANMGIDRRHAIALAARDCAVRSKDVSGLAWEMR